MSSAVLRIRLYVLGNYPYIPMRGLDSWGWLIGWFLGVGGELWFSGVCWLVNCGVVWRGWLTRKMRLGLF